jgi:hypothetical protein
MTSKKRNRARMKKSFAPVSLAILGKPLPESAGDWLVLVRAMGRDPDPELDVGAIPAILMELAAVFREEWEEFGITLSVVSLAVVAELARSRPDRVFEFLEASQEACREVLNEIASRN